MYSIELTCVQELRIKFMHDLCVVHGTFIGSLLTLMQSMSDNSHTQMKHAYEIQVFDV